METLHQIKSNFYFYNNILGHIVDRINYSDIVINSNEIDYHLGLQLQLQSNYRRGNH